jgi:hypothetical protein
MATQFISSAIGLNESLQQNLVCCIHQGLLERPIIFPAPCMHRLCTDCFTEYLQSNGGQQICCPQCKALHRVPSTWTTDWFDRVLNSVVEELASSQSDINKKVTDFVQRSYRKFHTTPAQLKINSIMQLYNPKLKENFEKCKKQLGCYQVVTLLHGTDRKAALSIGGTGFAIPISFERTSKNGAEGELKFGKAIYFAHAKKASEYGKNTFVLADCIFGRTALTDKSVLQLTPEIVHAQGYDTIHFDNAIEGPVNQEWAIYRSEQCFPLCIIEYEFLDERSANEESVINQVFKTSLTSPDYKLLRSAINGTDNQCKAVLRVIGDAGSKELPQASAIMLTLLTNITQADIEMLFKRSNETIRILFLRALWQTGRRSTDLQWIIHQRIKWALLTDALNSSYADVSWRVCGVLANMAAQVRDVRRLLTAPEVLNQLMVVLQRAVRFQDKICIVTVLNLLANIAATEYAVMKLKSHILNYLNEHILDHRDEEIQEAGNRLFCNIIGKGVVTSDWQRRGYKDTMAAPSMEPTTK